MAIRNGNEVGDYAANSTGNAITGTIELRTFLGPFTRFHVQVNDETTLTADVPNQQARDFYVAQKVMLIFAQDACQVLLLDKEAVELERLAEVETV